MAVARVAVKALAYVILDSPDLDTWERFGSDVLGMEPEDFSLLYQDTDAGPADAGSCASQTTMNNGRAVIEAAGEVRRTLLDLAAEELEAAPGDLELTGGLVRVKGSPSLSISVAELAASGTPILGKGSAQAIENPPADAEGCVGRLGNESFLAPQVFTHAARVKLDRETGVVRVLQVAAAHDSGVILNPAGANGQVYGGVAMGIGLALLESSQLDDQGRQTNPHLLDYKLVTAADSPRIDIAWVETPAVDAGPKGSKGVGEPPCVPTAGAVANAISKLTAEPIRRLPMTPERIWAASRDASS